MTPADLAAIRRLVYELETQDTRSTSEPLFVVYSGTSERGSRRPWRFHAAFLTNDEAMQFLERERYNLPETAFVFVESGFNNPEAKTIRRALPALLAEVDRLRAALAAKGAT